MRCPYCGNGDTKVIDSRSYGSGSTIKRRRECLSCFNRFNTTEKIFKLPLRVIKHNGTKEDYSRNKVYQGIVRSLVKRDYDEHKLEHLIEEIERKILNEYNGEIKSNILGQIIMDSLLDLDEVAYVRFASVYNKFDNIDDFLSIIKEVKKRKRVKK